MSKRGAYAVRIKRSAEKETDALAANTFERIAQAILKLELEPRPRGAKRLRGAEDHRLRVGAYRILYSIDDRQRQIVVSGVEDRRDVYRSL